MNNIGAIIKQKRLQLELPQVLLAEQLNVGAGTVANWEHSRSIPDICRLPRIIEFLGYDPLESSKKNGLTQRLGTRSVPFLPCYIENEKPLTGFCGCNPFENPFGKNSP